MTDRPDTLAQTIRVALGDLFVGDVPQDEPAHFRWRKAHAAVDELERLLEQRTQENEQDGDREQEPQPAKRIVPISHHATRQDSQQ